ncbi:MAG: Ig-like protein [Frankiales bacterium]|jgi:outer membrane protein assembly factor BamB|nr:Ig-like protein [Frankiales bacterium]
MRVKTAVLIGAALVAAAITGTNVNAAAAVPVITPGHAAYPSGGTTVIGEGVDADNQNAQLAETLTSQLKAAWRAEPPVGPQSAGSDPGTIMVVGSHTVVRETQYQQTYVSSYNTATGALQWRRSYHFAKTATVSGGLVYVSHDKLANGEVDVDAIDIATGALKWSSYDGGDELGTPLSVGSGLIMSSTWADDAATGKHKFTIKLVANASTDGTAFIAGGHIYFNSMNSIAAYSASTGALQWSYTKPSGFGPGAGSATPALHNGLLYVHSIYGQTHSTTLVLNPSTGKLVRTLPRSDSPIAFDGPVGIFTYADLNEPSVLSAVNLTTGHVYWTHPLPQTADGATGEVTTPIIANGLVWILDGIDTGHPGHIAALDEVTGQTRSLIVAPCLLGFGNLAIAQHRLLAPTSCGLATYTAVNV